MRFLRAVATPMDSRWSGCRSWMSVMRPGFTRSIVSSICFKKREWSLVVKEKCCDVAAVV